MRTPFLLLLTGLLLLAACKPCDDPTNPECENYCDDPANPDCFNFDPCLGKVPVSAEFEIAEVLSTIWSSNFLTLFVPTDTTVSQNQVRFKANQEADYYEWHIGGDPRTFHTREVALWFNQPTELLVVLITKRSPDSLCFPGDDGADTVTRRLVVMPMNKSALIGKFEGATDQNPLERYVVEFVNYSYPATPQIFHSVRLTGVTPGCSNLYAHVDVNSGAWGYRKFISKGGVLPEDNCFAGSIQASLSDDNDSLFVQFKRHDSVFPHSVVNSKVFFRGARMR